MQFQLSPCPDAPIGLIAQVPMVLLAQPAMAAGGLAGFIARHALPVAEVWVVDPDRGNRPLFRHAMAAQGFTMETEHLQATGDSYKGRLLRFCRA